MWFRVHYTKNFIDGILTGLKFTTHLDYPVSMFNQVEKILYNGAIMGTELLKFELSNVQFEILPKGNYNDQVSRQVL